MVNPLKRCNECARLAVLYIPGEPLGECKSCGWRQTRPSIWARIRTGGAYYERGFPYLMLLVALLLAGCGAHVEQEPPVGCSEAWSRCMALPDSSLEFASSGVEEIVSCTTTVAGVSSTYACRWPEQ